MNKSISIFFVLVTASLFLGDGKQGVVEPLFAIGIAVMYFFFLRDKKKISPLSGRLTVLWCGLIVYTAVRGLFSDSVAYSLSWLVRLIEGYLLYRLFSSLASPAAVRWFTRGLVGVTVFASFCSLLFLQLPAAASFLPTMNLLFANYGHNHLATLLLIIFPIVLLYMTKNPRVWVLLLFFFITLMMILTVSRGAWILLSFFLFIVALSKQVRKERLVHALTVGTGLVFVCAGIVLYVAALQGNTKKDSFLPGLLYRQVQKPLPGEDSRFLYWKQGWAALVRRPIFGSGPGTYQLAAKRFAAGAATPWYAHNFLLQTGVETGIVGLLLYLALNAGVLGRMKESLLDSHRQGLLYGTLLLFLYSFYEITFDFLTLWLIFWACLGILEKKQIQPDTNPNSGLSKDLRAMLVFIITVYCIWILQPIAQKRILPPPLSFGLVLPVEVNTIRYFDELPVTDRLFGWSTALLEFMHRKDPKVLMAGAQALEERDPMAAQKYYISSLLLDPANTEYKKRYVSFVLSHPERPPAQPISEFMQTAAEAIPIPAGSNYIQGINQRDLLNVFIKTIHERPGVLNGRSLLSDFYYRWALNSLSVNFDFANRVFIQAIELDRANTYYKTQYVFYMLKHPGLINTKTAGFITDLLYKTTFTNNNFALSSIVTSPGRLQYALTLAARDLETTRPDEYFFPKLYYLWAMYTLPIDPGMARPLYVQAMYEAPEWSYFHLELASYDLYVLHDPKSSESVLTHCMTYSNPKEDCAAYQKRPLHRPGFFRQNILDIH